MNKYIAFISTIVFLSLPLVASAQDIGDIKKTQAELQAQEKKKFETAKEKAAAEKKMKSVQADLVTAFSMSLNGNAITVSNDVWKAMRRH